MAAHRNTIQSTLVLEAVCELHNHPTADEVYDKIASTHPSVGRGTVYRNLNKLSEAGKIRKLAIPDGADRYDHQCHEHYHARCLKCGRVFDVDMDVIPDLSQKIRDAHGFAFSGYDLVFRGVCPHCAH